MHTCPVCGFAGLADAPLNFTICPCCGTEFEYDDHLTTYAELRGRWLTNPRWWSPVDAPRECAYCGGRGYTEQHIIGYTQYEMDAGEECPAHHFERVPCDYCATLPALLDENEALEAKMQRQQLDKEHESALALLCGDHAQIWYTERNQIKAPKSGCIVCDAREQSDKLAGLLERANGYVPTIDIQLKREIQSALAALKEKR